MSRFRLGVLTVVTGVSGSGKSTLVNEILYRALAKEIYGSHDEPGAHDSIEGIEHLDKVIRIDQAAIGRTPRSNPATYTGLFTLIRDLYAMLPESRERGYKPGRFSFNVKGGRCEACQGDGLKRIEMNFLPDVYVTCDVCRGRRYNRETLQVKFKGYSIADMLDATVEEALPLMENFPQIRAKLQTLNDVGLGYVHLGQSSTTLSGGEAQRIKLAKELSKRQTGRTFYLLDEPTTGLHFDDVRKLLDVLQRLVELGNTVVVIEHNLDVIKTADWIIDLGPDGGEYGGQHRGERNARAGEPIEEELHGRGATPGAWPRPGGMSKYDQQPLDFSALKTVVAERTRRQGQDGRFRNPVSRRAAASRAGSILCRAFWPAILSAPWWMHSPPRAEAAKAILWGMGGHVIKCGLAPVLIDLMRRGYVTGFAMNGSASIHDFEIALAGHTSEDVEAVLPDGRFGAAEETGREMNRAIAGGRGGRPGYGRSAWPMARRDCAAQTRGFQPSAGGLSPRRRRLQSTWPSARIRRIRILPPTLRAIGESTHRDFRLFASQVADLDEGGVYLNVGSAVVHA